MNRKLWDSLLSLYGIYAFNYIVPLLTLPYLTRVLGPSEWGAVAFAEGYSNYIILLVEFGFGLSATREIARVRDNPDARSKQLAGVLGGQIVLSVVAILTIVVIVLSAPANTIPVNLIPSALLLAVGQAMSPMWYFQGIEKVRLMAIVNVVARLVGAAGIFLVVHSPADASASIAVRAVTIWAATIIGFVGAYRDTPYRAPNVRDTMRALREGRSLFLYRSAVSLYTTANVLILGLLCPATVVAYYAGAERISKWAVVGLQPITQAFYPRINHLLANQHEKANQTIKISMYITVGLGLLATATLFALAPTLVALVLGNEFHRAVPVLRLLALLPLLIAISIVFGVQWMLPLRMDKQYNTILIGAGVLNVALAVLLAPRLGEMAMALSVVAAEATVAAGVVWCVIRSGQSPWTRSKQDVRLNTEIAAPDAA